MRSKILTHYIRVRVSDTDHEFLQEHLKIKNLTISELLREYVSKLRSIKFQNGKHEGLGK